MLMNLWQRLLSNQDDRDVIIKCYKYPDRIRLSPLTRVSISPLGSRDRVFRSFEAIIDTGSPYTLISRDIIERYVGTEYATGGQKKLGGMVQDAETTVLEYDLNIQFSGTNLRHTVYCWERSGPPFGLIGRDLINKHGLVLDAPGFATGSPRYFIASLRSSN